MIDEPDTKTVHLLAKAPGIKIHQVASTQHYTMPMRTDMAPYDDNNIRLALKWSIPRQEILNKVQGGFGVVGNDVPISPLQRYHNPNLEQYELDPDKAAFYYKKAGAPKLTFQLYAAEASWNDTFWKHPRFNYLMVQARGELNDDRRREMYYEMAQIVHEDGGAVVLMFTDLIMAATYTLKRPDRPMRGVFFMDGYQVAEEWWFDS